MPARKPAVAGLFYPADPADLTKTIATFFAEVDKIPIDGNPFGLIVPHAGYPYSGRIAAKAYKMLAGLTYDTVVIISPSHTVFFKGASIYDGDAYSTPLGEVAVDRDLADRLGTLHPSVYVSEKGHATGSTRGEHALEVQLPFLQIILGDNFQLVPIVMGDQEDDTITGLAEALSAGLKGRNALMIASTDLSHFHSEKQARRLDHQVQAAVERFDADGLLDVLQTGKGEACGGGPMAAIMMAARRLGASGVQAIDYATSAETTGDFENVVGYLSAVVFGKAKRSATAVTLGQPAASPADTELSRSAQEQLLDIARMAIESKLNGIEFSPMAYPELDVTRGVFVTLNLDGQLRGCIGQIRARQPLFQAVTDMAIAAAFEDPRFVPLTEAEAERAEVEISVLTPLQRVRSVDEIEVGRDGLMIKLDFHSGLLLPQVAVENKWGALTFLEQTCLKAGLSKSSHKDKFAEIYRFSAQVF